MVARLKLTLEQDEYSALLRMAHSEMRDPVSQVRFIVRKELVDIGMLNSKEKSKSPKSIEVVKNDRS